MRLRLKLDRQTDRQTDTANWEVVVWHCGDTRTLFILFSVAHLAQILRKYRVQSTVLPALIVKKIPGIFLRLQGRRPRLNPYPGLYVFVPPTGVGLVVC